MSANDNLEDVLSGIFDKTEGVSMLEGRSSRLKCASVERVRLRPRVRAPASSLLLRAVADAHKSLLNTPSTNADKDSQVRCALVLPMRRSVEPQKNTIQVAADNSQETGDSISLGGDMDSGDDKSENVSGAAQAGMVSSVPGVPLRLGLRLRAPSLPACAATACTGTRHLHPC
ncbi:unnamed protein product [Arctia plantaginis]|uniref:Uncharacterized protein n=1 Tax=Arctia plantaginis TaxID=874455 RepID=A0A8S1B898_ARCPL|nr:unnamed protein product [Arctia plantaginis]